MAISYSQYAKYYDSRMGEPIKKVELINSWIKKYNPKATSVLEIACGTGAVLKLMEKKYTVSGLDFSLEMLNIAKKKIKKGNFYHKDMANFSLNKKFDVVLCIFDAINHLINMRDWDKTFKNASIHLNPKGLFIFDINTLAKWDRFEKTNNESVEYVNKNILINRIQRLNKSKIVFSKKILEHETNNLYKLFEENIYEVAFEKEKVIKLLEKYFEIITIIDTNRKKPSKNSERLYFVCKLR